MEEYLKRIRISAGLGENLFTMKRGSFNYRQKVRNKRAFRVGKAPDGRFRFMIASGQALDKEKQFYGTSVVVKTDVCARDLVQSTIEAGFEPHFAVIYGDAADALEALGHMLNTEVVRF